MRRLPLVLALTAYAAAIAPIAVATPFSSARLASPRALLDKIYIISKDGNTISPKDIAGLRKNDGRWRLSAAKDKLDVRLTDEQTTQLLACTGQITCPTRKGKNKETAVSVIRPDLLVTARHGLFPKDGRRTVLLGRCSFHNYLDVTANIPVMVDEALYRSAYYFNNFDYAVLKLKRPLKGCNGFALDATGSPLEPGTHILSVTANQKGMLNPVSDKEPVIANGQIKQVFTGAFDGPALYWSDVDLGAGGSGGAVFALDDQDALVAGGDGRLVLKALAIASGLNGKNGQPYTGDMDKGNQSILIAADTVFAKAVATMAEQTDVATTPTLVAKSQRHKKAHFARRRRLRVRLRAETGVSR